MPAVRDLRSGFRQWRADRPFWGGLLLTLGGAEILLTEKASLKVVMHIGMQGMAGYLLPTIMILCGLLILFNPAQRLFYSLLGILLSLGTWLTSNLGGFFIGLLLGATGSCLASAGFRTRSRASGVRCAGAVGSRWRPRRRDRGVEKG
jgi:hypothetical protein